MSGSENDKVSDEKLPWIRSFGISCAFLGLWYLNQHPSLFLEAESRFLRSLALYVPTQGALLWYWVVCITWIFSVRSKDESGKWRKCWVLGYVCAWFLSYLLFIYLGNLSVSVGLRAALGRSFKGIPLSAEIWSWVFFFFIDFGLTLWIADAYGLIQSLPIEKEKHVRGRKFITFEEAKSISAKKTEGDGPGAYFGWLRVPESQVTTHFAVVGGTGSGKTTVIREMMQSVLHRVGKGNDVRALLYDAKRDMLPILSGMKLKAEVLTLHPFDERGVSWDMAKDIVSPAACEQMATILIPREKFASNPFFSDAARALMTGVLTVFIQRGAHWTLRDVVLALSNMSRLKSILSQSEETKELIEQYFSNERTANDIMSTVGTKIQRYTYVAAAWEKASRKISLRDWVSGEYIIVLGNDEETRSAIDALNQVIFKRISELILNQSESSTRRTWIFLDEVKEAGELPGFSSLLSKGRSKGACVAIGFQDIEGLGAAFRDSRVAHEIVGLCANKAILRLDSAETASWASQLFGEKEIEERRLSHGDSSGKGERGNKYSSTSTSESWVNVKKQAVLPSEFLKMTPVEKEGALPGYYIVPSIGAYQVNITASSIWKDLPPVDETEHGFKQRSVQDQFMRAWEGSDWVRLGLKWEEEPVVFTRAVGDGLSQRGSVGIGETEEENLLERIKR